MIIQGHRISWDTTIVEYTKGLTERIATEKVWLDHIAKLALAQYKQFDADCQSGLINADIRRDFLKAFANFFQLLKQPRTTNEFDEIIVACEKEKVA